MSSLNMEQQADETALNSLLTDLTATRSEAVKLVTDLTASRAEVVKLVTDLTASRAELVKVVTDCLTLRGPLNAILSGSATWDPGSLADGVGETSASITVTGAGLGDFAIVSAPYDLQGVSCTAYVDNANSVKIRLQNESGGTLDLASGTWRVRVFQQASFAGAAAMTAAAPAAMTAAAPAAMTAAAAAALTTTAGT